MISNPFTGQTLNASYSFKTDRLITGLKNANDTLARRTPKDYGRGAGWNLKATRKMAAKKLRKERATSGRKATAKKYSQVYR